MSDATAGNDTVAARVHGGDIEQYVMEQPVGAHTRPKVAAEQRFDLQTAAATFADPDRGEQVLQRYDFKDGYARRWIDTDGNYVAVWVFRFTTTRDGADFATFYERTNAAGSWGDPQTVPGVPGAEAFAKQKVSADGLQAAMSVAGRGDIVAVVNESELPPAGTTAPDQVLKTEVGLL